MLRITKYVVKCQQSVNTLGILRAIYGVKGSIRIIKSMGKIALIFWDSTPLWRIFKKRKEKET